MVSPLCTVNLASTTDGVNVAASSTVTIRLADLAGVNAWSIQCVSTDDLHSAATINAGLTINAVTRTATFTAPSGTTGSALMFESKVNNGRDVNGRPVDAYVSRFGVYVLAVTGRRVLAADQTTEGSAGFGWVKDVNTVLRTAGSVPDPLTIGTLNVGDIIGVTGIDGSGNDVSFPMTALLLYPDDGVYIQDQNALGVRRVDLISTSNIASLSGVVTSIDSVTATAFMRVLLTGQTNPIQNGIWVVQSGAWVRAHDWENQGHAFPGAIVVALRGTARAGKAYRLTGTTNVAPGTDSQTFAALEWGSGGGGGTSISQAGGSVSVDGSGYIEVLAAAGVLIDSGTTFGTQIYGDAYTQLTVNDGPLTIEASESVGITGDGITVTTTGGEINIGTDEDSVVHIGSEDSGDVSVAGATLDLAGTTSVSLRGANCYEVHDASSASHRITIRDAGGDNAMVGLYDNAASSETYVGDYTLSSAEELVFNGDVGGPYYSYFGLGGYVAGYAWYAQMQGAMYWQITSSITLLSGNKARIYSDEQIEIDSNWAVRLYSRNAGSLRRIEIGDSNVDRVYIKFPADTATTNATLTTLATFSPSARPSTYHVRIVATHADGSTAYWDYPDAPNAVGPVRAALRSGSAAIDSGSVSADPVMTTGGGSTINAATVTIDASGTTVRVRGTGVAATNITWAVTVIEIM